ncbi:hypothetical protein [Streptomyces massasporeus]|uniref:hypothetical protein n=1 Tax=Streptomyces massasporeus TaxID=67324 RepID=UPI003326FD04
MRTRVTRTVRLLTVLAVGAASAGAAAGCGSTEAGRGGAPPRSIESTPRTGTRARQVADAWDGSKAAEEWHEGFYPLGEVVQLPEGGLRGEADQRAWDIGNVDLKGKVPGTEPGSGRVTWESGSSLAAPLLQADQAYRTLGHAGGPGPRLTVTAARLGDMKVTTSRGPATVPAWLFTLDGYDSPLKRAAVSPSGLPASPIEPLGQDVPTDVLAPLGGLTKTARDGRSLTVVATHGSCDDGPTVKALETSGSVVLSASTTNTEDGPCTSELRGEKVPVKLDRPLGERIVLDAFTGRPVPYGEWPVTAQSRS